MTMSVAHPALVNHAKGWSVGCTRPAARAGVIEQSHQRCAALGLTRVERPDFEPLMRTDLNVARERNQRLFMHAAPVMEMLFEQIVNSDSMIVLTDATGHHPAFGRRRRIPGARAQGGAVAGRQLGRAVQGHERHRHRAVRGVAHARAWQRTLHARQQLSHLFGGADLRPARQHPRRARCDRRPALVSPAHDGAGAHVGAHDREPLAVRRLRQPPAAALPQPRRSSSARCSRASSSSVQTARCSAPTAARSTSWPSAARRCACKACPACSAPRSRPCSIISARRWRCRCACHLRGWAAVPRQCPLRSVLALDPVQPGRRVERRIAAGTGQQPGRAARPGPDAAARRVPADAGSSRSEPAHGTAVRAELSQDRRCADRHRGQQGAAHPEPRHRAADPRRDRHRQGTAGARAAPGLGPGPPGPSSPSTAHRFRSR